MTDQEKENKVTENKKENTTLKYDDTPPEMPVVMDPGLAYGTEPDYYSYMSVGDKTLKDYLALPEGSRIEMIDGRFYNMASPTSLHTLLGAELYTAFKNLIKKNGGPCVPLLAPIDVCLDANGKTMVQPDVFIICDQSKKIFPYVKGAPDLVVEIVSPSNQAMDVVKKRYKYQKAGVREYWMIFPEEKKIEVCSFENDRDMVYSFEDQIPIGIWANQCSIDFLELYESVHFVLDRKA